MGFAVATMRDPCRWEGERFHPCDLNRFNLADLRNDKAFWQECTDNLRAEFGLPEATIGG